MAKTKELFDVKGFKLTANEKSVYDKVVELGTVNYNDIAGACGVSPKSATSTLARLATVHGLLTKNEPVKVTTYEIADTDEVEAE